MLKKEDIVTIVSEETGYDKKETSQIFEKTISIIKKAMSEGKKVHILGFGTFETRDRKPTMGRNPRSPNEIVKIPSYKSPVFSVSKTFKNQIKNLTSKEVNPETEMEGNYE